MTPEASTPTTSDPIEPPAPVKIGELDSTPKPPPSVVFPFPTDPELNEETVGHSSRRRRATAALFERWARQLRREADYLDGLLEVPECFAFKKTQLGRN